MSPALKGTLEASMSPGSVPVTLQKRKKSKEGDDDEEENEAPYRGKLSFAEK